MKSENGQFQRRRWLTAYAPLIVWIFVVLGLGTGLGAMDETSRIIRPFLEWLLPNSLPATITSIHAVIRKSAHVTEYAILAFLAIRAFSASSAEFVKPSRFWLAFVVVILVAGTDEFHQSQELSRTGSIYDVLLDCTGGLIMILCHGLFSRRRTHRPTT